MDRPVLFCYDGSDGSKAALSVAVDLVMHPPMRSCCLCGRR